MLELHPAQLVTARKNNNEHAACRPRGGTAAPRVQLFHQSMHRAPKKISVKVYNTQQSMKGGIFTKNDHNNSCRSSKMAARRASGAGKEGFLPKRNTRPHRRSLCLASLSSKPPVLAQCPRAVHVCCRCNLAGFGSPPPSQTPSLASRWRKGTGTDRKRRSRLRRKSGRGRRWGSGQAWRRKSACVQSRKRGVTTSISVVCFASHFCLITWNPLLRHVRTTCASTKIGSTNE